LRRASTGVQDRIAEATGTADEAFSQIRTVQSFTREGEEVRRYDSHLREVIDAAMRRARIRGAFFGILTFCGFGGVVAVLWQGGRLVLNGTLTAGALVSFLLYALYVAGAVGSLASLFGAYQEAVGAARRVFDYGCGAGDYLAAIRALAGGVATGISGERAWDQSPFTVRELYARSPSADALRPLLISFEEASYGHRAPDAAMYQRAEDAAAAYRPRAA